MNDTRKDIVYNKKIHEEEEKLSQKRKSVKDQQQKVQADDTQEGGEATPAAPPAPPPATQIEQVLFADMLSYQSVYTYNLLIVILCSMDT